MEVAEDGQAGWEALEKGNYDILITDHDMPRLKGLDLIKRLRLAGNTIPVILASASQHENEAALRAPPYFATPVWKPFSVGEMVAKIESARGPVAGQDYPLP